MSITIKVTDGSVGKKITIDPTDTIGEVKIKIQESFEMLYPINLFRLDETLIDDVDQINALTVLTDNMKIIARPLASLETMRLQDTEFGMKKAHSITQLRENETVKVPDFFILFITTESFSANIIAIETSLEEIKERTMRSHSICSMWRNEWYYASLEKKSACQNWQMVALGIISDNSLQTTIWQSMGREKTRDLGMIDVMEQYTSKPIEVIKIDIRILLQQMIEIAQNDNIHLNFAMPLNYNYESKKLVTQ